MPTSISLLLIAGIVAMFMYVFLKSCKNTTPQHEIWMHKVNDFDYCEYDKAKALYHKALARNIEGSTIIVRDENSNVVFHGKASDYFERYEHNEL